MNLLMRVASRQHNVEPDRQIAGSLHTNVKTRDLPGAKCHAHLPTGSVQKLTSAICGPQVRRILRCLLASSRVPPARVLVPRSTRVLGRRAHTIMHASLVVASSQLSISRNWLIGDPSGSVRAGGRISELADESFGGWLQCRWVASDWPGQGWVPWAEVGEFRSGEWTGEVGLLLTI